MKTKKLTDESIAQISEETRDVFFKLMKRLNLFFLRWNVPFTVYVLFEYLIRQGGHAEAAEMADELTIPRQTMTALLDSLEKQNVLTREPHPHDRRRKIIRLTEKGHKKIQTLKLETQSMEVAAMAALGEGDMRRLLQLMYKYANSMEQAIQTYNGPITPF